MAEQYRAQWNHDDPDVTRRVAVAAAKWIRGKYGQELLDDGSAHTRTFSADGTECVASLDIVDGNEDGAATVSFRFTETQPSGTFWQTEIVAAQGPDEALADYYCSVSTEQVDPRTTIDIAAPKVAIELLNDATSANWPLDAKSMALDADLAQVFGDALASLDRGVPFVVLRPTDDSAETLDDARATADRIARRLAGLCSVQVLNSELEAALSDRFAPRGFFVPAGHVRVFHPSANGWDLATRANPMRRLAAREAISGWVTAQVAPRSVVRQPQPAIAKYLRSDRALTVVGGGAEQGDAGRVEALEKQNKRLSNTIVQLERDNARLLLDADEQHLEYGVLSEEFAQVNVSFAKSDASLRATQSALWFALSAYPELKDQLREKDLLPWADDEVDAPVTVAELAGDEDPGTSADCFEFAREFLGDWLSIPAEAGRDLDALDGSASASVWAAKSWRAFLALAAYAEAKAQRDDVTGFWEWCESGAPLHWPATERALAMKESDTTMNTRKFAAARNFPLAEGETMVMQAHIKIQEGGNDTIPRIYFAYDDDLGKVRVGFFGPHYLVPNPSAS